ncbi:hypothetical protein E2562_005351 [Oryza meyeriana var. granulata]|uniref:NAC domain-containing protein n=1 Tax=Oryza meyeriana var. granulata TaxID=110450 RepID=A0A6G1DEX3_9ORYZ|nr:hypothetical protein E2562_005351 [Oryza meyeriana var. granulata]
MEEAVAGGEPAPSTLDIVPRHDDVNHEDSGSMSQMGKTAVGGGGGGDGAGQQLVQYADTKPPGVRFRPNDQELIIHYLRPKYVLRDDMPTDIVKPLNVCKLDLDELHGDLGLGESLDGAWYVFSPRNRYYEHGTRPARGIKTKTVGYWKSNSAEADIVDDDSKVIGRVNTLTLALGRQPKGVATHWRMKEYRIPQFQIPLGQDSTRLLDEWVLCKLYHSYAYKQKGKGKVHEEASKPDGGVQELSVDEYGICDIEASKTDGGLQDLSVDDYGICDIEIAPQYIGET